MNIVLFGATGGTGKNVLRRALGAGHTVTVVARKPAAIETTHEQLTVKKGDVLDSESIALAVKGADAIVSTFGPADNKRPGTLMSNGIANIVRACEAGGVKRLVFESGLMMTDGSELSFFSSFGVSIYRMLNRALHDDKRLAETSIRESKLDWVIVRPPSLDHSPATNDVVVGPLARVNAAKKLSHDDAAAALVRALTEGAWTKKIVNVGH